MLSTNLQHLLRKITIVETNHLTKLDSDTMRADDWMFIFDDFDGWVTLKVSSEQNSGYWMHPTLYPASIIDKALKEGINDFNFNTETAAYSHVMSKNDHRLEPFWNEASGFDKSEIPLFFSRHYYGHPKGKENYIEFNQIVTHPLGLHWSETRKAYCSVNEMGDEIEKIKLIVENGLELILIKRKTLDKLLYLGKWVLVRYFDFNRYLGNIPLFTGNKSKVIDSEKHNAHYEIWSFNEEDKIKYIEFRGVQITKPLNPNAELLSWDSDDNDKPKKYESFIVYDWKNKQLIRDYSISPDNFANYYTESKLPFEISPIFFNAEVLDKYKNNPDKYKITERSISCRGGWILESYDINEHNQVHIYAIYLSRLPHKEQLQWKQYNETPNGPISQRAFQNDFEGRWYGKESKLHQLQKSLKELGEINFDETIGPIWSPKGGSWEHASKGLYYLKTENQNQWHDFTIALANAVNEGLQTESLKKIAKNLGNTNDQIKSLGLLKFIIEKIEPASLSMTHGILNDLNKKRGQGKAHGTWKKPEGSLIKDAEQQLNNVIIAIDKLRNIFSQFENQKISV